MTTRDPPDKPYSSAPDNSPYKTLQRVETKAHVGTPKSPKHTLRDPNSPKEKKYLQTLGPNVGIFCT